MKTTMPNLNEMKNYIEGVSYSLYNANDSVEYEFKYFYPNSNIIVSISIDNENVVFVEIDGSIRYRLSITRNKRTEEFTIEEINLV